MTNVNSSEIKVSGKSEIKLSGKSEINLSGKSKYYINDGNEGESCEMHS